MIIFTIFASLPYPVPPRYAAAIVAVFNWTALTRGGFVLAYYLYLCVGNRAATKTTKIYGVVDVVITRGRVTPGWTYRCLAKYWNISFVFVFDMVELMHCDCTLIIISLSGFVKRKTIRKLEVAAHRVVCRCGFATFGSVRLWIGTLAISANAPL